MHWVQEMGLNNQSPSPLEFCQPRVWEMVRHKKIMQYTELERMKGLYIEGEEDGRREEAEGTKEAG